MSIKAVIFDWAGTMVDFGSRAPVRAMQNVFAGEKLPVNEDLIRAYMGMAKREHVVSILKTGDTADRWLEAHGQAWTETDVDRMMLALEPAMRDAATELSQLVPGAKATIDWLRAQGIKVGSTTGYTRSMMEGILPAAKTQGYEPEHLVCAGETPTGRPAPYMIWENLIALDTWPAVNAVKVDDAPVGIEAAKHAGTWSIGVAASGNALGLSYADFLAMAPAQRSDAVKAAAQPFLDAGANLVLETVAELPRAIEQIQTASRSGQTPGSFSGGLLIDPI